MSEKLNIYQKLAYVQNELKAPKGQLNKFGNYKYRNCEDILEAVKPINFKWGALVTLTDEIVLKGDRYYVEATATFIDTDSSATYSVKSLAREEEVKKGMDSSQITGSSSSYARKYALNGLYNIDDTKDSDSTNKHDKDESPQEYDNTTGELKVGTKKQEFTSKNAVEFDPSEDKPISATQSLLITQMSTPERIAKVLEFYKVSELKDLNELQASIVLKKFIDEKTKK